MCAVALCTLQATVLTELWLSVIAEQMGVDDLPATVEPSMLENDDFMRRFHHALLEVRTPLSSSLSRKPEFAGCERKRIIYFFGVSRQVHLEEGALVCPETGRRFPVSKGIPNMLLNEDEL